MQIETQKIKNALLVFFLLTIFGISASIFAEENSLGTDNIFLDSDQDGLSDTEEASYGTDPKNQDSDGDGYSDGAEIKSGYDPLKPAPGDKISEDTPTKINIDNDTLSGENLTEDLSIKLATMASDEEIGPGEISLTDINSLVDESVYEEIDVEDLPKIDESTIKIKEQDYSDLSEEKRAQKLKEDDDEYASTVLYIMSNNLPHNITVESEFVSFYQEVASKISRLVSDPEEMKYFDELAEKGNIILKQMNEVEVPKSMIDIHIEALEIATYAISLRDKVKIDLNDPIASLLSMSGVESLLVMTSEFIEKIENEDGSIKNNSETKESEEINTEEDSTAEITASDEEVTDSDTDETTESSNDSE